MKKAVVYLFALGLLMSTPAMAALQGSGSATSAEKKHEGKKKGKAKKAEATEKKEDKKEEKKEEKKDAGAAKKEEPAKKAKKS